nr:unnamed protein product [Callosobruchus analis]
MIFGTLRRSNDGSYALDRLRYCDKFEIFDDAAVMVGHLGGLQAKVKEKYEQFIFLRCMADRLNLVLKG